MRHHRHPDVGFDELDQIELTGDFKAVIDVDAVLAQVRQDPLGMLAKGPAQQLFRAQIIEFDIALLGEVVALADHQVEIFGKQRPGIEPLPGFVDLGGDAELRFALLQEFADLAAGAAQEAEFEPVELSLDLVEVRNEQRKITECVRAMRSAPISPLLNDEASERAPAAAS